MKLARPVAVAILSLWLLGAGPVPKDCGGRPRFVSGDNVLPEVWKRVPPDISSCKGRRSGSVVVSGVVTAIGRIRNVRIVRSVTPCVDRAVLAAVQQWTFCPGTTRGRPHEFLSEYTVRVKYD